MRAPGLVALAELHEGDGYGCRARDEHTQDRHEFHKVGEYAQQHRVRHRVMTDARGDLSVSLARGQPSTERHSGASELGGRYPGVSAAATSTARARLRTNPAHIHLTWLKRGGDICTRGRG